MNASITISTTRAGIACFGKSWGPKDIECTGGVDPGYVHPYTKENRRDPCELQDACSARVAADKLDKLRILPVSNLLRGKQEPTVQFNIPQQARQVPVIGPTAHTNTAPSHLTHAPQHHYTGSYLAVPEQHIEGEPFSHFLFRTAIRSLLRGLFQGLAHVFDNHKLK